MSLSVLKNEIIASSFQKFRPLDFFGIRISTFVATSLICIPCVILIGVLSEYPQISFILAAIIVGGTFYNLERLRGGKYENEKFEKLISKFQSPFSQINLNQSEISKSEINDALDWYLPSGDDLIGFKLMDIADTGFDAFVQEIIPLLPTGASVKFMRHQKPDFDAPEHLKVYGVSTSNYFIFVRIPMQIIGNALKKSEFKNQVLSIKNSNVHRMTCDEISQTAENIFFPFLNPSGNRIPFFRSNIEISEGLAKGLWPNINIASISLVQLPEEYVTRDFEKIFQVFSHLPHTVCLTMERIELSKIEMGYRNHFKKTYNKIDDNSINTQTQGDLKPMKMHLGILVHGSDEQIRDAVFQLDKVCLDLGSDFRPIFGLDLSFLNKALKLYLPGSRPQFPFGFRLSTINSMKELLCYLPRPELSESMNDYDLIFRTTTNKMFTIKQDSKYPVACISDMGAGKSFLLSLNIFAHILKRITEQTAGCYIELGGSFRFLMTEDLSLADIYFVLRTQSNGDISPLQDHPLKAFRHFGNRGHESAIKWIKTLCGLDIYPQETVQKAEYIIAKAVDKFYKKNDHDDSLIEYCIILKDILIEEFKDINTNPDHIWRTFSKNLSRYADKNRWGKIFCPEKTLNFDYTSARFAYFSSFESKLDLEDIYKPFFSFAVLLSNLIAEKYSSNQAHPSRIQFMIDEMNVLRRFIPDDLYIDLNATSRKEGKIPMLATQQLLDLTLDHNKWGEDKKYRIVKSIKRLWFYQFPGPTSTLAELIGTTTDDPILQKIRDVSNSNLNLKTKGIYAWGYLDESKKVRQLIIDSDKLTLWASTTHPGGIAVREACLKTGLFSYWTTCELLAAKLWPIPEQTGIPQATLDKIVNEVIFTAKKEGGNCDGKQKESNLNG